MADPNPISQITVEANGLTFGALACGDEGPLALCLHGFPDSAWTWRHLLPELAAAGFRAVAPFLRGYAPTSVPADGVHQTGAHVADALALYDELGGDGDAVLVGHDVGAIAAYPLLGRDPGRWRRAVTIAVPPPPSVMANFFTYRQLKRSWYTFLFQTPFAEMAVAMEDLAFVAHLWQDWSPGFDGSEFVERAKESLRDPANLASAIGWYRATLGSGPHTDEYDALEQPAMGTIEVPTLYLHGRDDGCLGSEGIDDAVLETLVAPGSRLEVIDGVGHFLHVERPDEVNRLIVDFVSA